MELEIHTSVLLWAAIIAVVLGAVAAKTNFCTMGAVSDWVNMGDTGRMLSWFLAIAVAIIGVAIAQYLAIFDTIDSRVPYRGALFFWPRYLFGGLMFGVGMTLASGCGNKNLVRIGGGNIKSIFVILMAGVGAYLMTKTDFYGTVFHSWMEPISPDLAQMDIADQSLGTIINSLAGLDIAGMNVWVGLVLAVCLLFIVFRSAEFRSNSDLILGGSIVGLAVFAGWYISGGPMGVEWMDAVDFMDEPPVSTGMQSYTFMNPTGEFLSYAGSGFDNLLLTFGLAAMAGVIVGSFLYAILSGTFRIEWFASIKDFINHFIGGSLMGIGGVLAMGCTIGQGVTGVSTLALGSFIALASIIVGSALTMKVQLYKMMYEEEATFAKALITGMADLKLLPNNMRKLDAI